MVLADGVSQREVARRFGLRGKRELRLWSIRDSERESCRDRRSRGLISSKHGSHRD